MDALELLKADHDTVRSLFAQFRQARETGDGDRLVEVQREIFTELDVHTSIEEEVFYPEAEEVGGEAEELVKEGVEEHHVVEVLMGEIDELDPGDDAFAAKMTVLIENVEHHAEEEEEELFPKLREAFGDERLQKMGERLAAAKQRHQSSRAGEPTREELYERAKQRDIQGRSSMTKEELEQALGESG